MPPKSNQYNTNVYDKEYYDSSCGIPYIRNEHWLKFFGKIAKEIKEKVNPKTVLDVGCAKGFLVEQLHKNKITAYGIDISQYAINEVSKEIKQYCKIGSILEPFDRDYDLIVCIEVLEHLYREDADKAVENICKHAKSVIFSSSPVDFEEKTHHNIQKPVFWTKLFAKYGFYKDEKLDLSFINPWADKFDKREISKDDLIQMYESKLWKNFKGNNELRKQISILEDSPLGFLLILYSKREDLQNEFTEVLKGDYQRLLEWAISVGKSNTRDSQKEKISSFLSTYEAYLTAIHSAIEKSKLEEQISINNEQIRVLGEQKKVLELTKMENDSKIKELELSIDEKDYNTNMLEKNIDELQIQEKVLTFEIDTIRNGIPYMFARDIATLLDKKLSPNSKIGKVVRKIAFSIYNKRLKENQQNTSEAFYEYEFNDYISQDEIKRIIESLSYKPKISIVMPVYNTEPVFLKRAIESVKNQYYSNWQLCICDDGSIDEVRKILKNESENDERINVVYSTKNQGISSASNLALNLTEGEFITLLDHDDELAKNALLEVVRIINTNKDDIDFIYSDEDKIGEENDHTEPFFKPNWSPDLLFSYNYPIHISVFRASLLKKIGGFRKEYDGSQDYDLILRYLESTEKIFHIPKVLYSWRKISGSTALSLSEKSYAYEAGKKAIQNALKRRNLDAECEKGIQLGTYRVKYNIRASPLVSIIIPTRSIENLKVCVKSIVEQSTFKNFEIIVLDSSQKNKIKKFCEKFDKIIYENVFQESFNFSKVNNDGVKISNGDYVIFLNDDTEVKSSRWIEDLLEHAQREEVGIVGAKLLYENDQVQHAGTVIGIENHAGNYGGMHESDGGYFGFARITRNCSAVTAACMMMKKDDFVSIGGFDEELAQSWQDVDLGIRIINSGKIIVFTPYSLLYHYEGKTRGRVDSSKEELKARKIFRKKNLTFVRNGDPYYNPNLSLNRPYKIINTYPKPIKVLAEIYERRMDLHQTFPNEHRNNFKSMIDWAATHGILTDDEKDIFQPYYDYYHKNCSDSAKPLADNISAFIENKELQEKFPEVNEGDLDRFLLHMKKYKMDDKEDKKKNFQ